MARPSDYLVSPAWLESRLESEIVILDCSHQAAYKRMHIRGAVGLPIDYWLKENDVSGVARGERLISVVEFGKLMGGLGIDRATTVVTYDDNQGRAAARVWWVLKYYGHHDVRVLNGGWSRWFIEGRPISPEVPRPSARVYEACPQPSLKIDVDELLSNLSNYQIVDARSLDEWSGIDPHGNPRSGRIPGAVNLEWSRFVTEPPGERFRTREELASIVKATKLDPTKPTVTYCQAGVRAAHVALVLLSLGFRNVRLFDGSMREWSSRPDTPIEGVQTGGRKKMR